MRKKSILFISLAAFLLLSTGCSVLSQSTLTATQQGNKPNTSVVTPENGKEQGTDKDYAKVPGTDKDQDKDKDQSKDPENSKEKDPDKEKELEKEKETENGDADILTSTWSEYSNVTLPIFDHDNHEIGSLTCLDYSSLTDYGILYTKLPEDTSDNLDRVEYHLYDIETGEDHYLATIDDWYYAANYEAIAKDDHLYLSVSTGEYAVRENSTLTLYDIDLKNYEMKPLLVVEGGIPYDSYTIAGDKLYFTELLDTGDTDLITIDLKNKPKEPIYHAYSEKDVFVNRSVRRIVSDDQYVYMLILHWENENYYLDIDTYDHNLKRLKTVDITDTCVSMLYENDRTETQNEIMQFVSDLYIKDDLFFYRNFSITTFLGLLSDTKLERLAGTDDLIAEVGTVYENTDLLLMRLFGDDSANRDMRNVFYRIDPKDHKIQRAEFYSDNVLYTFRSALQNSKGKILLNVGYVPDDGNGALPERLYYFDVKDLEFETVE